MTGKIGTIRAMTNNTLDKVISLAKRRGFIFPGSLIYGGLANTYDLGPLGTEMKRNIVNLWWQSFVHKYPEIYGLDTSILMSPKVWQASGHTTSFSDILIDCKKCQYRARADHLIEENYPETKVEGKSPLLLFEIIKEKKIACPVCKAFDWTEPKEFNLLFETQVGIISAGKNSAYLRGETAQGMFINFSEVLDSIHPRLPFGLAQIGKVFRNEVTMGKFTFRVLEFDLAEFEYFIKEEEWEKWFDFWKQKTEDFALRLGIKKESLRWRAHSKDELSHYSKRTEDLEYHYPFGFKEWFAVAYRTDFDLKNHMEKSGVDLRYNDPETNKKFIPHVIEPTFGITRSLTTLLIDAYCEEKLKGKERVVLKLSPVIAPYKVAVFPLLANKPELVEKAKSVYQMLSSDYQTAWDERGNIGKRYYSQDEIGTPWCVTIDFKTLKDQTVTVRERDTAKQKRLKIAALKPYFTKLLQTC